MGWVAACFWEAWGCDACLPLHAPEAADRVPGACRGGTTWFQHCPDTPQPWPQASRGPSLEPEMSNI